MNYRMIKSIGLEKDPVYLQYISNYPGISYYIRHLSFDFVVNDVDLLGSLFVNFAVCHITMRITKSPFPRIFKRVKRSWYMISC